MGQGKWMLDAREVPWWHSLRSPGGSVCAAAWETEKRCVWKQWKAARKDKGGAQHAFGTMCCQYIPLREAG
jgi:hypothetical protein